MFAFKMLTHPIDEVILENSFDELMEDVRSYQFINICMGKMVRKWLAGQVNDANTEQTETKPTVTPLTIP